MNYCNVISHRGANKYAPQNTIPAFKKSLEIGCDGFETDVHCSSDGRVVICHNYTVDETSDGFGNISDMTLERLRDLDFGSYYSDEFKGTKIPLLEEFLEICANSDIKVMNIEIKSPHNGEKDIADKTIELVKKYNLFDRLIVSSFDPEILIRCKKVDSNCKTGFLYSPDNTFTIKKMIFNYVRFAKEIKVDYLHPHHSLVTKTYVDNLHFNGIGVNPWTVDDPDMAKKFIDYGVDGIITNCPDIVNQVITES